jgi:hypothetical protein
MRTLVRPAGNRPDVDPREIGQSAMRVIRELEDALSDTLGRDDGISALGVSEQINSISGATALILRRLRRDGSYSVPLAEMVSPTGRLDQDNCDRFDGFRAYAHRFGLRLWIHRIVSGTRVDYIPFAICRESDDAPRMIYLARLLATPYETGQWRDRFLEARCGPPS